MPLFSHSSSTHEWEHEKVEELIDLLKSIDERLENMASITDVLDAVAKLDGDVKALIASIQPAEDLQPVVDAVNAVDSEVTAATPAPPAPLA